jgi:hypothetical protein
LEELPQLGTAYLPSQHDLPVHGDPVDLKHVLRDIKTDRGRLHGGRLPSLWRSRRPLWHIAMPGAGAVHPINFERIV